MDPEESTTVLEDILNTLTYKQASQIVDCINIEHGAHSRSNDESELARKRDLKASHKSVVESTDTSIVFNMEDEEPSHFDFPELMVRCQKRFKTADNTPVKNNHYDCEPSDEGRLHNRGFKLKEKLQMDLFKDDYPDPLKK